MAEDELQRLTDSHSSFSPSFISYFAHSDGLRKMSEMKDGELRASWKQGSCQLNITLIKTQLVTGEILLHNSDRAEHGSPADLRGDRSSASQH